MSDQFALNQNEQDMMQPELSRAFRIQFARQVSTILSPVAVSLPLVVLVALYRSTNTLNALGYAIITLFFLSFGPMIYILIGVRSGKYTDIDLSLRTQRAGPFLFGIVSTTIGLLILTFAHGPKNLQTLLLITTISGVMMMVTTLWWKISIHASSLAGAVTILTSLYGSIVLPAYVLVVLVSWSRVVLRRHTIAQVVVGSIASIILPIVTFKIRGM
ncbi:MAG TPA: hypothetical protein VKY19_27990 [Ktedonosporobacter sp.]|jgi:membrane-associated phospholipid phosphatase|nr:hypothetical protein [Ktedonosporobacter sp.]